MICVKCGQDKSESEFYFKDKTKGRRSTECKSCHRVYRAQYYRDNKVKESKRAVTRNKKYRDEKRKKLREYLESHSCVDCGESDIVVLQFDHIDPSTKRNNVGTLLSSHSWEVVKQEIDKCEVRCANCHIKRTAKQFDWHYYR